jgi:hypothetical protein
MDESQTLRILDPWTMMYGEYEQEFIDELQCKIGPKHPLKHPLYRREVFAIAVRRDPNAVIFQTVDGEIYAIVHLTWSGRRETAIGKPLTELLEDRQAVAQRITADHAERLEQYKRLQDNGSEGPWAVFCDTQSFLR